MTTTTDIFSRAIAAADLELDVLEDLEAPALAAMTRTAYRLDLAVDGPGRIDRLLSVLADELRSLEPAAVRLAALEDVLEGAGPVPAELVRWVAGEVLLDAAL